MKRNVYAYYIEIKLLTVSINMISIFLNFKLFYSLPEKACQFTIKILRNKTAEVIFKVFMWFILSFDLTIAGIGIEC